MRILISSIFFILFSTSALSSEYSLSFFKKSNDDIKLLGETTLSLDDNKKNSFVESFVRTKNTKYISSKTILSKQSTLDKNDEPKTIEKSKIDFVDTGLFTTIFMVEDKLKVDFKYSELLGLNEVDGIRLPEILMHRVIREFGDITEIENKQFFLAKSEEAVINLNTFKNEKEIISFFLKIKKI